MDEKGELMEVEKYTYIPYSPQARATSSQSWCLRLRCNDEPNISLDSITMYISSRKGVTGLACMTIYRGGMVGRR
jgi:hypothetical protein